MLKLLLHPSDSFPHLYMLSSSVHTAELVSSIWKGNVKKVLCNYSVFSLKNAYNNKNLSLRIQKYKKNMFYNDFVSIIRSIHLTKIYH
jgi:hypothetical protein